MIGTDVEKNASDVLNDGLIASRLDGVVPEEAHAVSEQAWKRSSQRHEST